MDLAPSDQVFLLDRFDNFYEITIDRRKLGLRISKSKHDVGSRMDLLLGTPLIIIFIDKIMLLFCRCGPWLRVFYRSAAFDEQNNTHSFRKERLPHFNYDPTIGLLLGLNGLNHDTVAFVLRHICRGSGGWFPVLPAHVFAIQL